MRWLIGQPGPAFSVADVYDGWVEALTGLGEEVRTFNLDRRLQLLDAAHIPIGKIDEDGRAEVRKALTREEAVATAAHEIIYSLYLGWPDVVLLISAFFMPPYLLDVMRDRGHKVVLLHTEEPYQCDEQLIRAAHADLNLLNDPCNIQKYRDLGVPAHYMPHAYRPSVHYPDPAAQKLWDLSFIGTGFPSRIKFFEEMDLKGLDVYLGGPWMDLPEDSPLRDWCDTDPEGCIDNAETAGIYRQSKAGLNFYRREAEDAHVGEGWALSPREIEMAASGLFFLRDPRGEGDEVLDMLPTFTGPADAAEQLRWWIRHEGYRETTAQKAREAIADRTFTNHARKLLAMLDH